MVVFAWLFFLVLAANDLIQKSVAIFSRMFRKKNWHMLPARFLQSSMKHSVSSLLR
jgi:hypothetical protein